MLPDRGIVCLHRRSDGISTIPEDPNTLTRQSASMNNAPREPPPHPASRPHYIESCPFHGHATSMATSMAPCISAAVKIITIKLPHYKPTHMIRRC